MGFEIVVETEARIVTLHFRGIVGRDDLQRARVETPAAAGWSASFAHVLDFTAVERLELSAEEIQQMAGAPPIFAPGAVEILVAPAGSLKFGLSRMFQIYADGRRHVEVVESLVQARELAARRR